MIKTNRITVKTVFVQTQSVYINAITRFSKNFKDHQSHDQNNSIQSI